MDKTNIFQMYADILETEGLRSKFKSLSFYLKYYVFENIQLAGKSMIDIGSGSGVYSFFAGFAGARKVVCIEPEFEGSNETAIKRFERLSTRFSFPQIELKKIAFQDFENKGEKFDIILLHNAINHLDEEACINLQNSDKARKRYEAMFKQIEGISKRGTKLIIADCSRYNFFALLKIKNPFAPTIEWHKHQSPYFWCNFLRKFGFSDPRIKWTAPHKSFKILLGNPLAAYFLTSHFVLRLRRV